MNPFSWLRVRTATESSSRRTCRRQPASFRPRLEVLEDRVVPTHSWANLNTHTHWSDPDAWLEQTVPTSGEDVIFPFAEIPQASVMDMSLTIGNLTDQFHGDGEFSGNGTLTVSGNISLDVGQVARFDHGMTLVLAGGNMIQLPGDDTPGDFSELFLNCDLTAPTGFTVVGPGPLNNGNRGSRLYRNSDGGGATTNVAGTIVNQGVIFEVDHHDDWGTATIDMQQGSTLEQVGDGIASVNLDAGITFDGDCTVGRDVPGFAMDLGIAGPVHVATDSTVSFVGHSDTFTGPVLGNDGATLTLTGHALTTFSGNVSGNFNVVSSMLAGFGGPVSFGGLIQGNHTVTVNTSQLGWGVPGSIITDSDDFFVAAGAALVLNGTNSFTGTADITGSLISGNQDALGACAVKLHGGSAFTTLDAQSVAGAFDFDGAVRFVLGGDLTLSGAATLDSATTLQVPAADTLTLAGAVGGPSSLTKVGDGTLVLGSANSYAGKTVVAAGTLTLTNSQALGTSGFDTVVKSGAALQLQGGISVPTGHFLQLAGAGAGGAGVLESLGGSNAWASHINLADDTTISVDADSLRLGGPVTSAAGKGLTKIGPGKLILAGLNSYTGPTTVAAGILALQNNSALGAPGNATTVQDGATLQLAGEITVANQSLTLAGSGFHGQGALQSNGEFEATWAGSILLSGGPVSIRGAISNLGHHLTVSGAIGDGGNGLQLRKVGPGGLLLSAANSYSGGTQVVGGILFITNGQALGASPSTTTVQNGASLSLFGNITVANETLQLQGNLGLGFDEVNTWAGPVRLLSDSSISAAFDTGLLTISGVVSSNPGKKLIWDGLGELVLAAANTYSGGTVLLDGILKVTNSRALGAANTTTTVAVGATLLLQGGVAIANESLTLAGSGSRVDTELRSKSGSNSWAGSITLADNAGVMVDDGMLTLKNTLSGPGGLEKDGAGTLRLLGNSTYQGLTSVSAGSLVVDGNLGQTESVTVAGAASLFGTGTVAAPLGVAVQGVLHPGDPSLPGLLTVSGVALAHGAKFVAQLNGTQAGQQYAQLVVNGPVVLDTASVLQAKLGFAPQVGQSFTIISNQGGQAVQGHFLNKPEGSTFQVNGFTFQITYQGGGLDVVLTCIATPTPLPDFLPSAPAPTGAAPAVSGRISVSVPVRAPVRLQAPAPRLVTDTVVPHIPARRAPHGEFDAEP